MARPSNADLRRDQIAGALARLLPVTGYAGASTKAIAKEAGLSPGLVHHHFGSKEEILVAVVTDFAKRLEARIPEDGSERSPREALRGLVLAWLAPGPGADAGAVACWAALGAEAVHHPAVARVYAEAVGKQVERLAAALSRARPDRSVEEVRAVAAMVHGAIEGAFRLHASAPGTIPPGSAATALLGLVDAWLEVP
jgi:TetR/AcrR family transcriptional repressor of bet genes